jgi:hypothetical protein
MEKSTKAVTFDEQPKMKRDARQKSHLFQKKIKDGFFVRHLFSFSCRSLYVTALEWFVNFLWHSQNI